MVFEDKFQHPWAVLISGIGVVLTLLLNFVAGAWWASAQSERSTFLQNQVASMQTQMQTENKEKVELSIKIAHLEEAILQNTHVVGELSAHIAAIETHLYEIPQIKSHK